MQLRSAPTGGGVGRPTGGCVGRPISTHVSVFQSGHYNTWPSAWRTEDNDELCRECRRSLADVESRGRPCPLLSISPKRTS